MTDTQTTAPATLAEALLQLQATAINAAKANTAEVQMKGGGKYSYKYATLDDCWAAARNALNAAGLVVQQRTTREAVFTSLIHSASGESTPEVEIAILGGGTMQQLGSAITYARRYGLCVAVNVLTGEDDDGNAASQPPAPAEPRKVGPKALEQLDAVFAEYCAHRLPVEMLETKLVALGADQTDDINAAFESLTYENGKQLHSWMTGEVESVKDNADGEDSGGE